MSRLLYMSIFLCGGLILFITASLGFLRRREATVSPYILFHTLRDNSVAVIHRMTADGRYEQELLPQASDSYHLPVWSPDGRWIAFQMRGGIYRVRPSGHDVQMIRGGVGRILYLTWSGDWIVYEAQDINASDIYRMRPDGSEHSRLTVARNDDSSPVWSPDGQWIVFSSRRDESNDHEIYRMRSDGSDQERITVAPGDDYSPRYSPDGSWIVFMSMRDNVRDMYRIRPDGSEEARLLSSGRTIVCGIDVDDVKSIWSALVVGMENATTHPAATDCTQYPVLAAFKQQFQRVMSPAVSPDRAWIAFSAAESGQQMIYKMRTDGTGVTRLSKPSWAIGSIVWSPPMETGWRSGVDIIAGFALIALGLLSRRFNIGEHFAGWYDTPAP